LKTTVVARVAKIQLLQPVLNFPKKQGHKNIAAPRKERSAARPKEQSCRLFQEHHFAGLGKYAPIVRYSFNAVQIHP
jgi:hypothetical protein